MVVEGIRKAPRPSVDWVFRGGAGGRPLLEEDAAAREAAVSVLEAAYSSAPADDPPRKKPKRMKDKDGKALKEMSLDELREHLVSEGAEDLAEQIAKKDPDPKPASKEGEEKPVTKADVAEMIKEGLTQVTESIGDKLEESRASVEEKAEALVKERETARVYEAAADKLLRKAVDNGLPKSLAEEIRGRYAVLPSGPTSGLKIEESDLEVEEDGKKVTKTAEEIIESRVRADVDHGIKVLTEAGADPEVEGFGPSSAEEEETGEDGKPKKAKESKDSRPKPGGFMEAAEAHGVAPVKAEKTEEAA
jgi:hypothetical protein